MQVSVEAVSELNRKMTVEVPEDKIREQVATRLKSLAGKVKIDGFRPGKAPQSVIHKRYGASVRDEVVAELIQSSFYDAIRKEKLNPAAGPTITPELSGEGQGLKYVADFEVVPEFVLIPSEALEVKRYISEVTEQDLDIMTQRLQEQRKTWQESVREAREGDRLTISFEGKIGEESFTGDKAQEMPVVIGSNQLIPGFEEKLVGAAAGAHLEFDIDFPEDYAEKLAGKTAHFAVDVLKLEEGVLPELNEEFFVSYGVESGGLEAFRADIRANMEREMNRSLQARTKASVMDALYQANIALALPQVLIDQELNQLVEPYKQSAQKRKQAFDEGELIVRFEPIAKRRVALGLVLNKLIDNERLTVDAKKVRAAIEDLAASYENPEQVVNWYYANREQLRQVESAVLEDQAVDVILSKAKVTEERIEFQELMQSSQKANL